MFRAEDVRVCAIKGIVPGMLLSQRVLRSCRAVRGHGVLSLWAGLTDRTYCIAIYPNYHKSFDASSTYACKYICEDVSTEHGTMYNKQRREMVFIRGNEKGKQEARRLGRVKQQQALLEQLE